ncbi:hypothetical protein [Deinococcus sp.]|uniref:hypothetical protein n=1 Tax=Deinococcus sp. TaxID=47478 RepID=UPI0025EE1424|nr:hypothetical protein [Deinococcus sp.]
MSRLLTRGLALMTALTAAASTAHAADIRLGLNTSASLGCQIVGLRGAFHQDRLGLYGSVSYCTSPAGASFGGGVSFDVAKLNNFTPYVLAGLDTLPSGSLATNVGAGVRYGTPLFPAEGYLEVGAQFIRTALGVTIPGPRLALGVNYRLSIDNLKGTLIADPIQNQPESVKYAGTAPEECKVTQAQDVASARGTASSAVNSGVSDALGAYSAAYSNLSYTVQVGGVSIDGNSAKVSGSVSFKGTERASGSPFSGTYGGTVTLTRDGCGWRATGYTRS